MKITKHTYNKDSAYIANPPLFISAQDFVGIVNISLRHKNILVLSDIITELKKKLEIQYTDHIYFITRDHRSARFSKIVEENDKLKTVINYNAYTSEIYSIYSRITGISVMLLAEYDNPDHIWMFYRRENSNYIANSHWTYFEGHYQYNIADPKLYNIIAILYDKLNNIKYNI